MKKRCYKEYSTHYLLYGGRGIRVCDEWLNNFEAFLEWSMQNGYADDLTLDRYPDVDGNYEPSNCRWADWITQANNRRMRKDNTSGHPGVNFHKPTMRWHARVSIDGKRVYLGGFDDIDDAIAARSAATARKLAGKELTPCAKQPRASAAASIVKPSITVQTAVAS